MLRYDIDPIMSQSFAAQQHGSSVQLDSRGIAAKRIYLALVPLFASPMIFVIRNLFNFSGIFQIQCHCIISPVGMNIGMYM